MHHSTQLPKFQPLHPNQTNLIARNFFLAVLTFFILFTANRGAAADFPPPVDKIPYYSDSDLPSAQARTPGFSDVVESIRVSSAQGKESLAEILENLKKRFPDFFEFYALNYSSRSLQGSSRTSPRVIMHGNGDTFLAFNGDPKDRGYGNLEMFEFKGETGYEFHSIHFGKDGPPTPLQAGEIASTIGTIEISKANPGVCLRCHGENPRPIWDPYVVWPGFYGADDDGLFLYGRSKSDYAPFDGPDLDTPAFHQLRKSYKSNARYKVLDGILASGRIISSAKDRVNLNITKIFSNQMSQRLLAGLEHNEEALETIGAIEGCRVNYLPAELYAKNLVRLNEALLNQRQLFQETNGTYSFFSPGAVSFMAGNRLASNMTAYERAAAKYAQRDLSRYSYSRTRSVDLQDGKGGLHAMALISRQLLKQNFGHDVDFHHCDSILQRLE